MTAFIVSHRLQYAGFLFLFISGTFMISFFASALTHLSLVMCYFSICELLNVQSSPCCCGFVDVFHRDQVEHSIH